jgi:hypothetical protein
MRAREILQEDYNQNLESDLSNILVGAKGSGASEVNTQAVVDQLYLMGYAIDINSIMSLLSNNPVVQNATPEMINLTQPDGASAGEDNEEDSAEHVAKMAQDATHIG